MFEHAEMLKRRAYLRENGFDICDLTVEGLRAREFVGRRNIWDADFPKMLSVWVTVTEKRGENPREFMQTLVEMYSALGDVETSAFVLREMHDRYGAPIEETGLLRL